MTDEHHPISELLAPYARGDLGAPEASEVEAHLATCDECRGELQAVRALHGAPGNLSEKPALEEIERARLHRAVLAATTGERAEPPGPSWAARIAPALGAAALFALFIFGAAQLFTGGMGGSDESASSGADADSVDAGSSESELAYQDGALGLPATNPRVTSSFSSDAATEEGPDGGDGGDTPQSEGAGSEGSASTQLADSGSPPPYFEPQPRVLSEDALHRLGRKRDPFAAFRFGYALGDGTDREALTNALAMASPEPGEVRACANGVVDSDANALPAYGALGTFEGEYALVLGFVTTLRDSAALSRYDIWVWRFGDCSSAVDRLNPITRLQGQI